jgi:carbonic anhydrase
LQTGNARYIAGENRAHRVTAADRIRLGKSQQPFACIVTCSDSRVTPEIIFDQSLGGLFVVRIAGTILTPEVIGSVEFAIDPLGAKLIVVMAHSNCGAIAASVAKIPLTGAVEAVISRLTLIVQQKRSDGFEGHALESEVSKQNSRNLTAALIENSSDIENALKNSKVELHRAFYDIASGKVMWDY